jgi:hypothetical protein
MTLLDLVCAAPEVAQRVVTVSPDVSSSTNLGRWANNGRGLVRAGHHRLHRQQPHRRQTVTTTPATT